MRLLLTYPVDPKNRNAGILFKWAWSTGVYD